MWEDDLPDNTLGRVHALSALMPMRWIRTVWLRALFLVTKIVPRRPETKGLRALAFVHFARWSFVPAPPEARKRRLDRYLLFEADFNGSFSEYLDAFVVRLKKHMRNIWGACYEGPDMLSTTTFRAYGRAHERAAQYYYCPYPDATVKEVGAALRVTEDAKRLARRTVRGIGDGKPFPDSEFGLALDELIMQLQTAREPPSPPLWRGHLSTFAADVVRILRSSFLAVARPARSGNVSAVTVIMPLERNRAEPVMRAIAELKRPPGASEEALHSAALPSEGPPEAILQDAHFARFVVVDDLLHEGLADEPASLERPWLLFSAIMDAPPEAHLDKIAKTFSTVWTCCEGSTGSEGDGTARARSLLEKHLVKGGLFYAAYDNSVGEVKTALARRRELRRFAVWAQGREGVARRTEFVERFGHLSEEVGDRRS